MTEEPIVGSVVVRGRARPFAVFASGEVRIGEHLPMAPGRVLIEEERERAERRVRDEVEGGAEEVRVGEYFCHSCGEWVAATRERWSLGICLSCSLDRGSELRDA